MRSRAMRGCTGATRTCCIAEHSRPARTPDLSVTPSLPEGDFVLREGFFRRQLVLEHFDPRL
jgi:hypothetical protein